jgi:hypothetical protein
LWAAVAGYETMVKLLINMSEVDVDSEDRENG